MKLGDDVFLRAKIVEITENGVEVMVRKNLGLRHWVDADAIYCTPTQQDLAENFWIGAKGGLIAERHRRCMGDSIWLFLWCLLRQTQVSDSGEGVVNHGHPVTRAQISKETGFPEWQVKKWVDVLRRTEYIRTQSEASGIVIFVQNAKEKRSFL